MLPSSLGWRRRQHGP